MNTAFYCLSCKGICKEHDAVRLFQTGFYRCVIPMGICAECRGKSYDGWTMALNEHTANAAEHERIQTIPG